MKYELSAIERPHVVWISCDQLRADWLGVNGHPVVMTPQIDELAYEGINFQAAFSECPTCVPARRIMMTGLNTYGIQMNKNREAQPFTEGPKLAELMTRSGYQTFAAGKLHTSPKRNRIGFEDVQLNEEGRRDHVTWKDDYEQFLDDNGWGHMRYTHGLGNNEYGIRMEPLPERFTSTHWTAQKAMEFIERRDPTRPFFLHVSFDKPHPPISPLQSYYELYRDAVMPEPVRGDWVNNKLPNRVRYLQLRHNYDQWRQHPLMVQQTLKGYAASVTHIDSSIGVLLGTLREHKLLDKTLIVFTSDHGDNLFDHGAFAKGDFFRGSTNIPYIIRPPKHWNNEAGLSVVRGKMDKEIPVALMDVMPTILEACGIPVPERVEGRSLVPHLLGDPVRLREYTCGNCGTVFGLTDGQTKYIWFSDEDLELLFDVQGDPSECHDLSDDPAYRSILELSRSRLAGWLEKHGDPHARNGQLLPIPYDWQLDKAHATTSWNNRGRH
ncbi:sulfatase-like hydrolase/transferase [Paenibacillus periandrae]|uniref:sulfatase-like hydrolase/transferase n=1 Tax=Paenibacillus periandrae TaxID=1761741 RepID=UPI001F0984CB|nr:sulfatase-like hydrolase/transferase [Paenibacillus periandrae]